MNRLFIAAAAVLVVAYAAGQSHDRAAATTVEASSTPLVPVVDHHQHLLSPALAAALLSPVPATIGLPPELQRRFRTGAPKHNDSAAIADFYTEDAVLGFSWGTLAPASPTSWSHGRPMIASFLSRAFRNQPSLTPIAYDVHGSSGYIVGYLSGIPRHFDVHLSLRRGGDGAWRIAAQTITFAPRPTPPQPVTAKELVAQLDAAGIRRALVLSLAYAHGSPALRRDDEHARTRAENDWTAQQVARYPDRLRVFYSVNPLRDYALTELQRCADDPQLRHGLKLHLANSQVEFRNAQHVDQLRRVFRAANARRMPIVAHVWTGESYGQAEARVFLNEVLPAAPDIPIQIAHLAGAGPGLDQGSREALSVFADAVAARDPRTRNLYFDVTTIVTMQTSVEEAAFIVANIRKIGLSRILYGSDMAISGNPPARQSWGAFRAMLPLTEAEFRTVANNVAPYMR